MDEDKHWSMVILIILPPLPAAEAAVKEHELDDVHS
jgi:hypothetical protein